MPVDIFTLAQAQRVAVMLGLDPMALTEGDLVPRGWHFAMLAGQTPRDTLRSDGFPGLGAPMPQLGHPRLLLGSRSTTYNGDLRIGEGLERYSSIASITEKTGRNGPLSIVKVEHDLTGRETSCKVFETQTYFLAGLPAEAAPKPAPTTLPTDGVAKVVTPDDLMLFQYSALGFNTHRIHFDRDYALRVEGHPDLVVNGGLASLLVSEFMRADLGRKIKTLTSRHLAPLYVNRPLTICASDVTDTQAKVLLVDYAGIVAAELVILFDEL